VVDELFGFIQENTILSAGSIKNSVFYATFAVKFGYLNSDYFFHIHAHAKLPPKCFISETVSKVNRPLFQDVLCSFPILFAYISLT
jgi:hypothetical protein